MKINDTHAHILKVTCTLFLCSVDTKMASDRTQRHAVGDYLIKHNMADVCDLMVLISVGGL
jgi:hypothetical protein